MISLIVPTRNRAETLGIVARSYFEQHLVTEVIFVLDAGTDSTRDLLSQLAKNYPNVRLKIIANPSRLGASASRNVGVANASNDFILFCDDDEYLEKGYAEICLQKLKDRGSAIVSGRRVYMRRGETKEAAVRRFGIGVRGGPVFRPVICEYVNGARFAGDMFLPITNAIILTKRELLLKYPFDGNYSRGNGYREETDFQMNLFTRGLEILVTNDCHSIHLPFSQVRSGGQRASRVKRIYWSIYYTRYFFQKYYASYAARLGLRTPQWLALAAFACFAIYRETIRAGLYQLWSRLGARSE